MEFLGILILIIAAVFALGIWQTIVAKRQHETVTALSPARLRAFVDESFGKLLWAPVDGPGALNFRRRTPNDTGATISIDFETTADGKTVVQAWMSAWKSRYGLVASPGSGKAKAVIRKIDQAAV